MKLHRHHLAISLGTAAMLVATAGSAGIGARADTSTYQVNDYAQGQIDSILPPGENGLVNATQVAPAEAGTRPAGSDDQLSKYTTLIYGAGGLTDGNLGDYYDDESFGVQAADVVRTETPEAGITIYRDTHDVPHIYGSTLDTMSEGAGYAQAEDRLFLMDVLRHYGEGTLSSFLGPSCAFEQMDHDELLLAPYTQAQAEAQINALPAEYGAQGTLAVSLVNNYVKGINDYLTAATTNPALLPADYAAAVGTPQPWTAADVVAIAGLIGGIFGKGGGIEFQNAGLLHYLQKQLGTAAGAQAYSNFKDSNDPDAPTTIVDKTFPYEIPGTVDPSTTALPDNASTPLTGGPTDTTTGCNAGAATSTVTSALAITDALRATPKHMSNALVVNGDHTASGHPIAVFGPQVSYFAPQILAIEDLHGPGYDAEGASFPGTGLVELGRGQDYAWSATSAGTDLIDQRLEQTCVPGGGTPTADQPDYLYDGKCIAMTHETFADGTADIPKPGGTGVAVALSHSIYLTQHGVVQGWTTAGGKPVALVNQRSTYDHDIDSVVGFLAWGEPALTHDATSWMTGASEISYTFNWFYVDDRDTAYYTSGLDPVRPADVDPTLPTWGTGNAEWQGYLAADAHPHEINPPQGFFVSWNNKPAPGFAAADDQYGYGPVYRSQMLVNQLKAKFAATGNKVTRANVVQAMSIASTQDLDGVSVLPELLSYLGTAQEPASVASMLTILKAWVATGTHRIKSAPTDTQYRDAAAVAIMDELEDQLIQAIFNPILKAGGIGKVGSTGGAMTQGYTVLPMQWVNSPNSGDSHLGSAYDSGYESYLVKALRQLQGQTVAAPFGTAITGSWCGTGGTSACLASVNTALAATYANLVTANGGSTDASTWTASPDLVTDRTTENDSTETMPEYDSIHFETLGIIGQPAQDWQNRPTFQQVVEFPAHRARADAVTTPVSPTSPVKKKTTKKVTRPKTKTSEGKASQAGGTLAYTGVNAGLEWLAVALALSAAAAATLRRRRH